MNNRSRFLIAAAAVLAAAACDSAPTEPSSTEEPVTRSFLQVIQRGATEHWIEERLSDMDGVFVAMECPDGSESEMIRLSGKLYMKEKLLINHSTGVTIFNSTVRSIGLSGVGLVSGEEYRASERSHTTAVQLEKQNLHSVGRFRVAIDYFGKQSKRRYRMVIMENVVWGGEGDPIVERGIERVECDA